MMSAVPDGRTQTKEPKTASAPAHARQGQSRARWRTLVGWVVFLAVIVVFSTAVRAFALQTYYVPTPSMTPTLMPGDRIIVDKLSGTIHRGDIVVFHDVPADRGGPPTLVKRVIGLPGERISSRGDTVLIDGRPIGEPWLPRLVGECAQSAFMIRPTTIAPEHYFVMGDCRGDSGDSRFFGTVPVGNIVGKVDLIIWRSGHPWIHWF